MVFVPLRLSGEAAAPLAVMLGTDRDAPELLVVAQPPQQGLAVRLHGGAGAVLLPYVESFLGQSETVEKKNADPYQRALDAPQLLLPNPSGVAFTRLLGRSTRFRRPDGPYPVPAEVPLLGRWLTYFAERAAHPGSSLTLAATEELGRHWASGQSGLEDANLAALLGWISPPPGRTGHRPRRRPRTR
ncbi:hypothetical protein [Nonomuraea dietziae]|uniref:hypothetical protein n=1 Tax=Nonomuraea dietziae TaxID=65515 RepID=UPI0031E24AA8